MAHSLVPATAAPISTASRKNTHLPSLGFHRIWACHPGCDLALDDSLVRRRSITLRLAGAAVLVGNIGGNQSASAAARRPPPPPPEERKDPSLSGVQAKVLASKKRKEAMKEEVAKLRERGKTVKGPSD